MNAEGARAESLCAELMRAAGLRVLERNWRCRLGEIDLVAEERGMLVFAEVRMRSGPGFGGAGESVTAAKRQRLLAAFAGRKRCAGSTCSWSWRRQRAIVQRLWRVAPAFWVKAHAEAHSPPGAGLAAGRLPLSRRRRSARAASVTG
jgi:uncharacterized protein (TIGR00252 family)